MLQIETVFPAFARENTQPSQLFPHVYQFHEKYAISTLLIISLISMFLKPSGALRDPENLGF